MTRSSIEAAAYVYIISLTIVFIWTVVMVCQQIGWL